MSPSGSGRCAEILIIEDDPDIRETLRDTLELEGYDVSTASNGREGLELLHRIARPCVILLDLMMPVMNGLDFLDACGEDDALMTIPVVIVTAYEALARKSATRARAVIKKPIDLDHLLKFVTSYCGPGTAKPAS